MTGLHESNEFSETIYSVCLGKENCPASSQFTRVKLVCRADGRGDFQVEPRMSMRREICLGNVKVNWNTGQKNGSYNGLRFLRQAGQSARNFGTAQFNITNKLSTKQQAGLRKTAVIRCHFSE